MRPSSRGPKESQDVQRIPIIKISQNLAGESEATPLQIDSPKSRSVFAFNNLFSKTRLFQAFSSTAGRDREDKKTGSLEDQGNYMEKLETSQTMPIVELRVNHADSPKILKRHSSYEMLKHISFNPDFKSEVESSKATDVAAAAAALTKKSSRNLTDNRSSTQLDTITRSSFVIQKQGFLSKKADFSHGGWKLYHVVLRGGKLHFFKSPSKSAVKEYMCSSEGQGTRSRSGSLTKSQKTFDKRDASFPNAPSKSRMQMHPSDFEPSAQGELFVPDLSATLPGCHYGVTCTEVDRHHFRFKRYCSLVILGEKVITFKRKWVPQSSGGDTKGGKSAGGSYTKWKVDSTLYLESVEVLEAKSSNFQATTPSGANRSPSNADLSAGYNVRSLSPNNIPEDRSIGLNAVDLNINYGFQLFAQDTNTGASVNRLFVVKSEEIKEETFRMLNESKKILNRDKQNGKSAILMSNQRHPDLILDTSNQAAQSSNENDQIAKQLAEAFGDKINTSDVASSRNQGVIVGGTLDALIHEAIFSGLRKKRNNKFLMLFLDTLPKFMSTSFLIEELLRYIRLLNREGIVSENIIVNEVPCRIAEIFTIWINRCPSDFDDASFGQLKSFVQEMEGEEFEYLESAIDEQQQVRKNCLNFFGNQSKSLGINFDNELGISEFLKISSRDFSEQLYLCHYTCIYANSTLDMRYVFSNDRANISVNAISFSPLYPHFISEFMLSQLLKEATTNQVRARLLGHWILIAQRSHELGDSVSWFAIVTTLISPYVLRLHGSWLYVDSDIKDVFINKIIPDVSATGYFDDTTQVAGKVLWANRSVKSSIPCYYYLRSFVERTDRSGESGWIDDGQSVVNVRKRSHQHEEVEKALPPPEQLEMAPIPEFKVATKLQNFFMSLAKAQSRERSDWLQLSQSLEPSLDQMYNLSQENILPLSASTHNPMKFVDVIENVGLFMQNPSLNTDKNVVVRRKSTPDLFFSRGMRSSKSAMANRLGVSDYEGVFGQAKRIAIGDTDGIIGFLANNMSRNGSALDLSLNTKKTNTTTLIVAFNTNELIFKARWSSVESLSNGSVNQTISLSLTSGNLDGLAKLIAFDIQQLAPIFKYEEGGVLPATFHLAKISWDSSQFEKAFLATFRSFARSRTLYEALEKLYITMDDAVSMLLLSKIATVSVLNANANQDKLVLQAQLKILNFFRFWWTEYPYDLIEDRALVYIAQSFLSRIISSSDTVKDKSSYKFSGVGDTASLLKKFLSYTLYIGAVSESISSYEFPNLHPIECYDSVDLILGLNNFLVLHFQEITMHDWISTFNLMEDYSRDPLLWYPKSKVTVSDEEVFISDIFSLMTSCCKADSTQSMVSYLPEKVRRMVKIHTEIRTWVISQISSTKIGLKFRATRLKGLLDLIKICRKIRLIISSNGGTDIPSFIEYSISHAISSYESRIFSGAWIQVAPDTGCLESLEATVVALEEPNFFLAEQPNLVPNLGWILQSMAHMCITQQNYLSQSINFEKRMTLYALFDLCMNNRLTTSETRLSVMEKKFTVEQWKDIKEFAILENANMRSNFGGKGSKSFRVFSKLVSEQQEKHRKDYKRKESLEKESKEQAKDAKQNKKDHLFAEEVKKSKFSRMSAMMKGKIGLPLIDLSHGAATPAKMLQQQIDRYSSYNATAELAQMNKPSYVINLTGSSVSKHDYPKREFVFCLSTEDGAQHILQAGSSDEAVDWLNNLKSAASEATAKKMSILTEDMNDPTLQEMELTKESLVSKEKKGRNSDKAMSKDSLPLAVERLIREIEFRGIEEVGIYRVPGTQSKIERLMRELNKDPRNVDLADEEWGDINIVACTLKQYFRDLPEPLLTYDLYERFIEAVGIEDYDERLFTIKDLLEELPTSNYHLLKRLIEHLELITDYQEVNRMYATNLAIVFGPNLLRPQPGPDNLARIIQNLGHQQNVVKNLILQYHWLFDVEKEAEPEPERASAEYTSVAEYATGVGN